MKGHAKFQEAYSIGNTQKSKEMKTKCEASDEDDHPYFPWQKFGLNRKFEKVITFEPHEISTGSKRRFVHLDINVNQIINPRLQ